MLRPFYDPAQLKKVMSANARANQRPGKGQFADFSSMDCSNLDFSHYNLAGANFFAADLSLATFKHADLTNVRFDQANMRYVNLSKADCTGATFHDVNMDNMTANYTRFMNCNFSHVSMIGGNLWRADLNGCDFHDVDMTHVKVDAANFSGSTFGRVNFREIYGSPIPFHNVDLYDCQEIPERIYNQFNILPEGELIGWKRLDNDFIAKLLIPADAKRSCSSRRKCRASYVKVLIVDKADDLSYGNYIGHSVSYPETVYEVGNFVYPDWFDENKWHECSNGIHFFITREEAVNY